MFCCKKENKPVEVHEIISAQTQCKIDLYRSCGEEMAADLARLRPLVTQLETQNRALTSKLKRHKENNLQG